MAKQFSMICPHCGGRMTSLKAVRLSAMLTERTYQCLNEKHHCGFRMVSGDSPMRTLIPPSLPSATVDIPMAANREIRCE